MAELSIEERAGRYASDNINDSIISLSLGHRSANRVTDIYVRRNNLKIDQANRQVIDYLMSDDVIQY